jgi:hypothetical protein
LISGWWKTRVLTTRARVATRRGEPAQGERNAYEALTIAADLGAFLATADTLEYVAALAHLGESHRKAEPKLSR